MRHISSSSSSTYYEYLDKGRLHHVFNFDDSLYDIEMLSVDSGSALNGYPVSEKVDKALRAVILSYLSARHTLKAICYEESVKLKNVDDFNKSFIDTYATMNDEQKHLVDALMHIKSDYSPISNN